MLVICAAEVESVVVCGGPGANGLPDGLIEVIGIDGSEDVLVPSVPLALGPGAEPLAGPVGEEPGEALDEVDGLP